MNKVSDAASVAAAQARARRNHVKNTMALQEKVHRLNARLNDRPGDLRALKGMILS